jgi:hypothetical protein
VDGIFWPEPDNPWKKRSFLQAAIENGLKPIVTFRGGGMGARPRGETNCIQEQFRRQSLSY